MEKKPGAVIMVVGGALMAVGSFLTWLTATFDATVLVEPIKQQLGVDISNAPGFAALSQSSSAAGTGGWEGKLALVGGLLVLVVGIVALVRALTGSLASRAAFVGGAMGLFGALYVLLRKPGGVDEAKAGAAAAFTAAGIDPNLLDKAVKVSTGIGLYVVLAGGIVAIVGGIMLMRQKEPAAMMTATSTGATAAGSGWETPAAPMTPPPAPPVSMPTTPTPEPPTTPTPEPPAPVGDAGGPSDS